MDPNLDLTYKQLEHLSHLRRSILGVLKCLVGSIFFVVFDIGGTRPGWLALSAIFLVILGYYVIEFRRFHRREDPLLTNILYVLAWITLSIGEVITAVVMFVVALVLHPIRLAKKLTTE